MTRWMMIAGLILTLGSTSQYLLAWEGPQPQESATRFAETSKARYLSGELVYLDPVNRRGGIRLDGDQGRYFTGPPHWFALLPYAPVWRQGARGELRDIPLGTHVHGYFVPPPAGDETTIPALPDDKKQFAIAENHALTIEDDFSFYQRRGQAWKVLTVDVEKEKLRVEPIAVPLPQIVPTNPISTDFAPAQRLQLLGAGDAGQVVRDGIRTPYTFDIDARTEVWKSAQLAELRDVQAGMTVQLNLAWAQGWGQNEFRVGQIWLDEASRSRATQRQRDWHIQYERERWTAGWIDHVEHFDYGGGIVTLTLFEVDPQILADLWLDREERIAVAVAEKTRRTWFHRSDRKFAKLVEWKKLESPPLGSSGVQLRLKFVELLAGYTAGACVRVKAERWKFVTMPPEERLTSREDQQRGARMVLPW
jgi:hypothetical protein